MVNRSAGTSFRDGDTTEKQVSGQKSSTATDSQEVLEKNLNDFDIIKNELIYNYDEPTYHFTWGLIPENEFAFGFNSTPKQYREKNAELTEKLKASIFNTPTASASQPIIVAETGVTAGLNIRSVEFESVVGLSEMGVKGNQTTVKMEIFEPFGMALVDDLALAAKILGVKNWLHSPMHVLELRFKGKKKKNIEDPIAQKDETFDFGDCVWSPESRQKPNLYVWRLIITDFKAKVDQGGTVYNLIAALQENYAKDVQHVTLPKMITGSRKTPKEITTFVAEEWTTWIKEQREKNVAIPDHSFEIIWQSSEELEKDFALFNLKKTPPWEGEIAPAQEDSARTEGTGFKKDGTFAWNDGTSIQQIVKDLQAVTEELRILMHGKHIVAAGKQTGIATESNVEESKRVFKYEFRVETESIMKGFDSKTQEYAYHFVFHIIPFAVSTGISDEKKPKTRNKKIPENNQIQKNRRLRLNKAGVVRKKYDYIYTGLNQDVLDFNIDLNLFYFAQIPKATSSYVETDVGTIQTKAKSAFFNEIQQPGSLASKPGLREAILQLATAQQGKTGSSFQKFRDQLNLTDKKILTEGDLLDIGTRLAASGLRNDALIELAEDNANAIVQKQVAAAKNAVSQDVDVASAQQLLRSIADSGRGTFVDDKFVKTIENTLVTVNSFGLQGSRIQRNLQLVRTLEKLRGNFNNNNDEDGNKRRQLSAQINAIQGKISGDEQLNRQKADEFRRQSLKKSGRLTSRFLSDQKSLFDTPEARQQFEALVDESSTSLFPIAVKADITDLSAGGDKGPTQTDPASVSQSLTMAMMNQIYEGATPVFVKITLSIRGDPFWLGPGVERQTTFGRTIKEIDPDYNKKQAMFLLEFRFPKNYDPETGNMTLSTENMFKGLYTVITVKHEFKDGKFTQQLEAVRETLTNLLDEGEDNSVTVQEEPDTSISAAARNVVTSQNTLNLVGPF